MINEIDIALSEISFLSLREKVTLKKNLDSLRQLTLLSIEELSAIIGRKIKRGFWDGKSLSESAEKSLFIMEKLGINFVLHDMEDYPALLRESFNPPYALFYRGNIKVLQKNCISVVGTRQVSQDGAKAAFDFARDAADDLSCVVSGLAFGVDSFAHKGALSSEKEGATAAIIPSGIDNVVPSSNRKLASMILEKGGLLASEYVPGMGAERWRFVARNRIVASLSSSTVVIQSPKGSGAMITAEMALEANRGLYFHKAGLSQSSREVNAQTEKYRMACDRKFKDKMNRDPDLYIEDGAPVIESYRDYKRIHSEFPKVGLFES